MNPPRSAADAETLARVDAVNVQQGNIYAFALLRLIASDMENDVHADSSDNGMVETWAGMLRWIIEMLEGRNDDLRDYYTEAGWLQRYGQGGAA